MSQSTIDILMERIPGLKKVANTKGGEYKGPCPFCGGTDRFTVNPNHPDHEYGYYFCRKERIQGSLKTLFEKLGVKSKIKKQKNLDTSKKNRKDFTKDAKAQVIDPPSTKWQSAAQDLLEKLKPKKYLYDFLNSKKISSEMIERFNLTYSENAMYLNHQENESRWVSPGIFIPNYRKKILYSIHVRTLSGKPKYTYAGGSKAVPYVILNEEVQNLPVIIVESEFDAIRLFQAIGDKTHIIALASVNTRPDRYCEAIINLATHIFVCLDYDEAGFNEGTWWKSKYPKSHIIYAPRGKDITDTLLNDEKLQAWFDELVHLADNKIEIISRKQYTPKIYSVTKDNSVQILDFMKSAGVLSIITHDGPTGEMENLFICHEDKVFVFDKENINPDNLDILNQQVLVSFDAKDVMRSLHKSGISVKKIECAHLMTKTLPIKNISSIDELGHTFLGVRASDAAKEYDSNIYYQKSVEACIVYEAFTSKLTQSVIQHEARYEYYQLMAQSIPAVVQMEITGIPIDWSGHEQYIEKIKAILSEPGIKKHKYDKYISRLNTWGKLHTQYCEHSTRRVHPNYKYNSSATGRFSCVNPPMQGFPKDMNHLIKAPEGYVLVGADYSQLDLRVAAQESRDETMNRFFSEGVDIHRVLASKIFNVDEEKVTPMLRGESKSRIYKVIYGGHDSDLEKAMKSIFPKFFKWRRTLIKFKHHIFLRKFRYVEFKSSYNWKSLMVNYPIQSGSADVMFAALGILYPQIANTNSKIMHMVHDDITLLSPESEASKAAQILEKSMIDGFLKIYPDAPKEKLVSAKIGKTRADIK